MRFKKKHSVSLSHIEQLCCNHMVVIGSDLMDQLRNLVRITSTSKYINIKLRLNTLKLPFNRELRVSVSFSKYFRNIFCTVPSGYLWWLSFSSGSGFHLFLIKPINASLSLRRYFLEHGLQTDCQHGPKSFSTSAFILLSGKGKPLIVSFKAGNE